MKEKDWEAPAAGGEAARAAAALARLNLGEDPEEAGRLEGDLAKIVGYMDILKECDTSGVEPMYSPMLDPQPPRPDEPRQGGGGASPDSILEAAPETFGRFFSVPRVF
ncbi:MAG: Asp-tRNA(Asn)/Glu-tRNA(Gln) amidotransferase subunit GatC [Deltaproteobacteria bacterium]|jgi:aspartyl-tRNA(Asn)/glutamyl-tRNA(Gln) amidotransferase subunit C|nr:Asp-tRNA(Asn)/Glu-tRNA(Gln) amidotransferase subunit GatC [Deltaproteobacteria bacterium]